MDVILFKGDPQRINNSVNACAVIPWVCRRLKESPFNITELPVRRRRSAQADLRPLDYKCFLYGKSGPVFVQVSAAARMAKSSIPLMWSTVSECKPSTSSSCCSVSQAINAA